MSKEMNSTIVFTDTPYALAYADHVLHVVEQLCPSSPRASPSTQFVKSARANGPKRCVCLMLILEILPCGGVFGSVAWNLDPPRFSCALINLDRPCPPFTGLEGKTLSPTCNDPCAARSPADDG